MRDNRWNIIGAAAGAVFVVLVLVGNGMTPTAEAAGSMEAFLTELRAGGGFFGPAVALEMLGFVAFALFVSELHRRLRASDDRTLLPTVALVGGGLMLAVKLASGAPLVALDQRLADVDVATAQLLVDLNDGAFVLTWLPLGLFVLATSLSARRTGLFHSTLTWSGIVIGAASIAGTLVAGAGPAVIAFLLSLLWMLATSVVIVVGDVRRRVESLAPAWSVEV